MTFEIPESLEVALKQHAAVRGISPDRYVREILERDLKSVFDTPLVPFKNSRGLLKQYGPAPTDEEMEENRVDMLKGSIFARDAA